MKIRYVLLLAVISPVLAIAQDTIQKRNGDTIVANILKITEDEIMFHYPEETWVRRLSKGSLEKISYEDGGLLEFNTQKLETEVTITKYFEQTEGLEQIGELYVEARGILASREKLWKMCRKKIADKARKLGADTVLLTMEGYTPSSVPNFFMRGLAYRKKEVKKN